MLVPHHPGWGKSERPQWLRSVRDIAAMHSWLLSELGVHDVSLVGLGFGGWIAAEMASQAPAAYRKLILVGAMGINPPGGYIADQAIVSYLDYPQAGFHDEGRVHPCLWRCIHRPARAVGHLPRDGVPHCLEALQKWQPDAAAPCSAASLQTPALVVWGDDDKHVPKSAGEVYAKGIPNARLETVSACGHYVDMEKPDELAKLVTHVRQRRDAEGNHAMHLMYFTEQPMGAYDAKEGLKYGATALTFSNSNFDPTAASKPYAQRVSSKSTSWPTSGASTASC